MKIEPEKYYSLEEIAEILNLNYRTVLTAVTSKRLKGVKFGRVWRVLGQELLNFVKVDD